MSFRDDEIRERCHALEPISTGHPTVLHKLDRIRAVLFDVYGTLLISASGDIATGLTLATDDAFAEALAAIGFQLSQEAGTPSLLDEIDADHERARQGGIDYPEVEIVEIWRRTLAKLEKKGQIEALSATASDGDASELQLRRLALEYEMRVNPVWPMPGARESLDQLECVGLTLGLVSNAQFFTMDLLRSLLFGFGDRVLFDEELRFLSYQHGRAKPSTYLFELASEALRCRGIHHDEVLYVGNDMLNDIMPANSIGFRTALFAGDARSLRLREDVPSVHGCAPDLVVTDLLDLVRCLR